MAVKYARAGGGNWSADDTWSTSSGGPADTTKPVAGDTANLDVNSGQVTVDVNSACAILNCTGYTNTFTLNADMTTTSSVTFVAGMTFTPNTYTWNLGGGTLTPAGKSFYNLNFTTSATYTIQALVTVTNTLSVPNGVQVRLQGVSGDMFSLSGDLSILGNGCLGQYGSGRNIILNGNTIMTFSGTVHDENNGGHLGMNVKINTAGTITMAPDTYMMGTVTYVTGTVVIPDTLTFIMGGGFYGCSGLTWKNVVLAGQNSAAFYFNSDVYISGNLTKTNNSYLLYPSDYATPWKVYVSGNLTNSGTGDIQTGYGSSIVMNGTGVVSAVGRLLCNLTIDTTGTITLSGTIIMGQGTFKYTAGTLITTGFTLQSNYTHTFDLNGVTVANLTLQYPTLSSGQAWTFVSGTTLIVTGLFSMNVPITATGTFTIKSSVTSSSAGLKILGSTNVQNAKAFDIDSSGGKQVVNLFGVNTRTVNWSTFPTSTVSGVWVG